MNKRIGVSPRIFVSYGKEDGAIAEELANALERANCTVWLDKRNIKAGRLWKKEISSAIWSSDYFIALVSTRSLARRGYIHSELKEALSVWAQTPFSRVYLIPVRIDDCDISHAGLSDLQWVDLYDHTALTLSFRSWEIAMSSIMAVVSEGRGYSPNAMTPELVASISKYHTDRKEFERSVAQAKSNANILGVLEARSQFAEYLTVTLFQDVCREGGFSSSKFALIARGGFGRRHMTKSSDIDLTLLHTNADARDAQKLFDVFSMLLTDVWAQTKVAAIINTVDECKSHWHTNFSSLVAFSTARPIWGDYSLSAELNSSWKQYVCSMDSAAIRRGVQQQSFYKATEIEMLPGLFNVKHSAGALMEIAHVGFLEQALTIRNVEWSNLQPSGEDLARARDFMLQLREEIYIVSKTTAVTTSGLSIIAQRTFPQSKKANELLLDQLQLHRGHVRQRLVALLNLMT